MNLDDLVSSTLHDLNSNQQESEDQKVEAEEDILGKLRRMDEHDLDEMITSISASLASDSKLLALLHQTLSETVAADDVYCDPDNEGHEDLAKSVLDMIGKMNL